MFGELAHKVRTSVNPQLVSYLTPPYVTGIGGYYWMHPYTAAVGTAAKCVDNFGQIAALPWIVPNTITLTQIGIEITVAGDAGTVLRFAIYADNGQWTPGVLLRDLGTIAADVGIITNPSFTAAFSFTLQPGIYWAAMTPQNTTVPGTNRPTTGALTAASVPFMSPGMSGFAIQTPLGVASRTWHGWSPSTTPAFTAPTTTFYTAGNWGGGSVTSGNPWPRFAIHIL